MDPITRIDKLIEAFQPPEDKHKLPASGPLAPFEQAIDRMVEASNIAAKATAKAAIKQAQLREEFEKKISFLSGQVHRAESALAAMESSLDRLQQDPGASQIVTGKSHEVVYWKTRLHQYIENSQLGDNS